MTSATEHRGFSSAVDSLPFRGREYVGGYFEARLTLRLRNGIAPASIANLADLNGLVNDFLSRLFQDEPASAGVDNPLRLAIRRGPARPRVPIGKTVRARGRGWRAPGTRHPREPAQA